MLLVTPKNTRWRRWARWMLLVLIASYIWYASHESPHGGTWMGITYGILGLAIVLILLFYGIRKRWYRCSMGSTEAWLHSHIYLGLLVLVIILFHSGFRFHDKVAIAALAMLGVVVLSGLVGSILYTILPRMLTDVESNLMIQEMSDQINQLAQSMARLASGKSNAFQAVYASLISKDYPISLGGWRIIFSRYMMKKTGEIEDNLRQTYLHQIGSDELADLNQLLVLARQRKQIHDRLIHQQHYKNMMGAWLYLHVPFSIAMMVAIVAHVAAVFYYL